MKIWTPMRSAKKPGAFANTSDATGFWNQMGLVAPNWFGSWSLVPHVRGDISAVHSGPMKLLAVDLLGDFRAQKEGLLVASGTFSSSKRRRNTWMKTHLLSLDIDDGSDPTQLLAAFPKVGMLLHGSWNDWRTKKDSPAQSRYRAYIPLLAPIISLGDYDLLWKWLAAHCRQHGVTLDPSTKDPNRIMYTLRDGTGRPPDKEGHPPQWSGARGGVALGVEDLPDGTRLTELKVKAELAIEKARRAARAALSRSRGNSRQELSSAAHRRFYAAVVRLISTRQPGDGRNTGVFAAGALLGSYVASGLIDDPHACKARIVDAAQRSGLNNDIERQLENGYSLGLTRPLAL